MANGFVYKDRIKRWYVCYKHGGKRIAYVVGSHKKEAGMVLQRIQSEMNAGKHNPAQFKAALRGQVAGDTFGELVNRFLEEYESARGPRTAYYHRYKSPWLGFFGESTKLADITPRRVEVYRNARATTCGPSTVRKDLVALSVMFRWAKRMGHWDSNPADDTVARPHEPRSKNRYLKNSERAKLLSKSPPWLRRIITWACETGLDRGVVLTMRWSDLELERDGRRILRGKIVMDRPKNGQIIDLTLSEHAIAALNDAAKVRHASGTIFLNQDAQPISKSGIERALTASLKAAGISGISFRSFRHTFATACVSEGIHVKYLGEMIGSSTKDVLDRYMHTTKRGHEDAAARLSKRVIPESDNSSAAC